MKEIDLCFASKTISGGGIQKNTKRKKYYPDISLCYHFWFCLIKYNLTYSWLHFKQFWILLFKKKKNQHPNIFSHIMNFLNCLQTITWFTESAYNTFHDCLSVFGWLYSCTGERFCLCINVCISGISY